MIPLAKVLRPFDATVQILADWLVPITFQILAD